MRYLFPFFFSLLFWVASGQITTNQASVEQSAEKLVSSFLTFSDVKDLYAVLHRTYQLHVLDESFQPNSLLLADLVNGIYQLKEFASTNGIIVGKTINYDALKIYIESNFQLRNMLIGEGIIDANGKYVPSAVKSIVERYNPSTRQLEPEKKEKKEKFDFKLENVDDVYQLIIHAFSEGLFDVNGFFLKSTFKEILSDEPNLAKLLMKEHIIDESFEPNIVRFQDFISKRHELEQLLTQSGVFVDKVFHPEMVKKILFSYNKVTRKLDLNLSTPVVVQTNLTSSAIAESLTHQYEQTETVSAKQMFTQLLADPSKHLRDAIVYGRRYGVFDNRGFFDFYNLYLLLAQDETFLQTAISKGIFDANRNFFPEKLRAYVLENTDLVIACQNIGVLTKQNTYQQSGIVAITNKHVSVKEKPPKAFDLNNPATVQTLPQLQLVLSLAFNAKIIDEKATFNFKNMYSFMKNNTQLSKNVESYLVLDGTNLKYSALRELISEWPLLRNVLVDAEVLNSFGQYEEIAFRKVIVNSVDLFKKQGLNIDNLVSKLNKTNLSTEELLSMEKTINQIIGVDDQKKTQTTEQPQTQTPSQPQTPITPAKTTATTSTTNTNAKANSDQKVIVKKKTRVSIPVIVTIAVCATILIVFFIVIAVVTRKSNRPQSKKKKGKMKSTDEEVYTKLS